MPMSVLILLQIKTGMLAVSKNKLPCIDIKYLVYANNVVMINTTIYHYSN